MKLSYHQEKTEDCDWIPGQRNRKKALTANHHVEVSSDARSHSHINYTVLYIFAQLLVL